MAVERISTEEAHRRHESDQDDVLLVCAYEDEDKCRDMLIEDSLTLKELKDKERDQDLPKDQDIIFYCA